MSRGRWVAWGAVIALLLGRGLARGQVLAATLIAVAMAAAGLVGWFLIDRPQDRTRERKAKGLCLRCGYDLRGNVSGVCPECGEDRQAVHRCN
jgi:hypothetical protein